MEKLNRRWRDNKHDLKINFYDRYPTDAERRENIDLLRMSTAQWDEMFKMWNDEKFQVRVVDKLFNSDNLCCVIL